MSTPEFAKEYFQKRAQPAGAIFKGKDFSIFRYTFWERTIRKRLQRGKFLDIGCAEGSLLKWAEKRGYETYGLDISEFAVHQLSQKKLKKTMLTLGDINNLPYMDNCFDIITAYDVLEHLQQPSLGLQEINRCLKIGGLLFLSMPNIDSYGRALYGNNWFGYKDETHVSLLPTEKWKTNLKENGFTIVDSFYDRIVDLPNFIHSASIIQRTIDKLIRLFLVLAASKLPKRWGENLHFVARKTVENI